MSPAAVWIPGWLIKWLAVILAVAAVVVIAVHLSILRVQVRQRTQELKEANESLRATVEELEQAQLALATSEGQHRTTLDAMADAIHVVDENLTILIFNKRFQTWRRELGLEDDVDGRQLFEVMSFLSETVRSEYERVFAEGEVLITEEITEVAGREFVVETRKIPVFEGQRVVRVATVIRDITVPRRAEDALRESEERFRGIIDASPMGINSYKLDEDRRLIFVGGNPAADRILGLDHSALIGKEIGEAFPGVRGTGLPERFRQVAAKGGTYHIDTLEYKDGRFSGTFAVHVFRTSPGSIAVMFHDVTERRQTEDAVRESEELYRAITVISPDAIIIHDADGGILFANPAAADSLGHQDPDELVGRQLFDFLVAADHDMARERIASAVSGQTLRPVLSQVVRRDGHMVFWESACAPIVYRGTQAVLTAARDTTRRQRAEGELRRRRAILEAISYSSEDLLKSDNWEVCVRDVLGRLGSAAGASRAYIWECEMGDDGEPWIRVEWEWLAPGVAAINRGEVPTPLSFAALGLEQFAAALSRRRIMQGHVRDLTDQESGFWQRRGVVSVMMVPIFIGDKWWGCIGFDACDEEREWAMMEVELLKTAADILCASIERRRAEATLADQNVVLEEANRQLEYLARTDSLTGLSNRQFFVTSLTEEMVRSRRYGAPLSIMLADLDHFKQINDTFGHLAGDDALRMCGQIIAEAMRETDLAGRYGGEEFCIMLTETDREGALVLAERLRELIAGGQHADGRGGVVQVTCSIGVASLDESVDGIIGFLKLADDALYAAKAGGRDQVCLASSGGEA